MRQIRTASAIALLAVSLAGCSSAATPAAPPATTPLSAAPAPPATGEPSTGGGPLTGGPSAPSTIVVAGGGGAQVPAPNPALTPGATFPSVTVALVCTPGYATSVRDVPDTEKAQVFARYGVADVAGMYEVDHLIPLELGGSNDLTNLWPEPYAGPWGARTKDKVEDGLHTEVCDGQSTLPAAQHLIATAWWTWPGVAASSSTPPAGPAGPAGSSPVRIISGPGQIAAGSIASVHAITSASVPCSLSVVLPSGRQSTASGLGPAAADGAGNITWTWRVTANTDPGTATATVTCSGGSASIAFQIT